MPRAYKLRKFQNGRNRDGDPHINYSLTIPSEIAENLPADMLFECELTDDGILFRPQNVEPKPVTLPTWAENVDGRKMGEVQTPGQLARKTRGRPNPKEQVAA